MAHKFYATKAWKKLRRRALTMNQVARHSTFPHCEICEEVGITTQATEVDHIKPHKGDYGLAFDPDNLQCLCKPCHSRKTYYEDGAFNRPAGGKAPVTGCDEDGIPLDPDHPWRKKISQG